MRTRRDVFNYLHALKTAQELQQTFDAEKIGINLEGESVPPEILAEKNKFHSGEIKYADLSQDAAMWMALESVAARRANPIFYSDLPGLLELETWSPSDAMLILSGIDPSGAIVDWSYQNFMGAEIQEPVIKHANWFTCATDLYDYPVIGDYDFSSIQLRRMICEALGAQDILAGKDEHIEHLKEELNEVERLEQDKTSRFKTSMLKLRAQMAGTLKARWDSGEHDTSQRRSPTFFLQWAESREFKIEWASWARENGFVCVDPPITAPPFFDADSEDYPRLLHIAVRAWQHASEHAEGTAKQRILEFLKARYEELSNSEKEAIALIANWQKVGGRPKIGG